MIRVIKMGLRLVQWRLAQARESLRQQDSPRNRLRRMEARYLREVYGQESTSSQTPKSSHNTKTTPTCLERPMSDDIQIEETLVPVLTLRLKTLNGVGEARFSNEALSIRKTDDGRLLIPLGAGFASYADATLLREMADYLESQQNVEEEEDVNTPTS